MRVLPNERRTRASVGTPLPDSKAEQPPVIRRAEVVAFALVALAGHRRRHRSLCRKGLLSPGRDGIRGRHHAVAGRRISRAASNSPLGVGGSDRGGGRRRRATFIVGLISSPLMEWSTRLPELGSLLRDKLHMFDRPLALWQQLQGMLGGSDTLSARRSRCRNSTGSSQPSNSCRRPSPSSCCSLPRWSCSSRAGETCAAR